MKFDRNMFDIKFIFLLCSLSFVEIKPDNDNFLDYLDPSNENQAFEFLANGKIDLVSNMKEYIQRQLDRKGIKNQIPYMNVVRCYLFKRPHL